MVQNGEALWRDWTSPENTKDSRERKQKKSASRTEEPTGWSLEVPVKESCKTVRIYALKRTVLSLLMMSYAY
jgi:hypothetical protein